jgi:hypothetical protein
MNTKNRIAADHTLEARLAACVAGSLTARAEMVPHDVAERLRFAREQALSRARLVLRAAPAAVQVIGVSKSGAATLGGFTPWWQRAAAALPLFVLVLGLVAIDHWAARERVVAAADVDAQLLSDDLPPAAYSDPGFAEFLRSTPKQ